ncbi:MAG: patatin-like protein [Egibacteraceae bacterium]
MSAPQLASKPKELRLAVAMRGGVSLAVWMGGVCREIARLRLRASTLPEASAEDKDVYRGLLRICGYERVTVDVLAGTSAGGLNGALLASHLVYGMPFGGGIRNLWLRLGDLESLTRHPSDPMPLSLLLGDRGFYERLFEGCRELFERWPPEVEDSAKDSASNVRLILTATRLRPRPDWVRPTFGSPLPASRARAHFRFRHRFVDTGDLFSDFPSGTTGEEALRRLSYAARSTSSFPGAFEPATPRVADGSGGEQAGQVDLRGVSSETGAPDSEKGWVELIDGGVLDNIPVSWAVRAIAGSPAFRPVDRWLLYLQPVPPQSPGGKAPAIGRGKRRVTRLVRMLRQTQAAKLKSESLLDDADELRAAAAASQARRAVAGGLPGTAADSSRGLAQERLPSYRELVGLAEGRRIACLLETPIDVVGPDPLRVPDQPCPLMTLDQVKGGSVELLAGLRHPATDALVLPFDPEDPEKLPHPEELPVCGRSPMAVARTVALLLDWVRAAERVDPDLADAVSKIREELYEARFAAEVLLAVRDRLILCCVAGLTSDDERDAIALVRQATAWLGDLVAGVGDMPGDGGWMAWSATLAGALNAGSSPPAPTAQWPVGLYEPLWDHLARIGIDLGQALDGCCPVPGFETLRSAATSDPPAGTASMRDALAYAEVFLGPLRPDPLAEATSIRFHIVSAANEGPLERHILGAVSDDERVNSKLSGNQLRNFAAFLSARWRLNDWIWGRLDAVSSLVDVTARPGRLQHYEGKETELFDKTRALFVGTAPDDAWRTFLEQKWERLEITPETVRERFTGIVTERLQWQVLAEELPVLLKLEGLDGDGDLPPMDDEDLTDIRPMIPTHVEAEAARLGLVGREDVRTLLRRPHLRRATARLGLVAWRAVQPSGTKVAPKLARFALRALEPLIYLPLLLAAVAPTGTIVGAALSWLAVAVVAGTWLSLPTHLAIALGASVAVGVRVWRGKRPQSATAGSGGGSGLDHGVPEPVPVWKAVSAGFGTLVVALVAARLLRGLMPFPSIGAGTAATIAAVFFTVAVLTVFWWLPGQGRLPRKRDDIGLLLLMAVGSAVAALLAARIAQLPWLTEHMRSWRMLLLLYAPLWVQSYLLAKRFPEPPNSAAASRRGARQSLSDM